MSQTTNLGLPLWGETPPEGATGLDLRNAILGENEDSMAQLLDKQVERLANKVTEITDEVTDEQYPSAKAIKDYVDKNGAKSILEDGKVKDEYLPEQLVTEEELKTALDEFEIVTSWNELEDRPFHDNEDGSVTQLDIKYLPDELVTETELALNVTVLLASAGLIVAAAVEDDTVLTEGEDHIYIL